MKNTPPESHPWLNTIQEFLFLEADLADNHQFKDWQALWTKDLLYWVPCHDEGVDPTHQVSIIYDDRSRLEERLFRLQTKQAHSQNPRSRLSRSVTNIRIESGDRETGFKVTSRIHVVESRLERVTHWAGRQTHRLVWEESVFHMSEKKIVLVNNDSLLGNLTFII